MGVEPSVKATPKIVKLNKALKLAESWVNNMSATVEDWNQLEPVARPLRLGLGAREMPSAKSAASTDPVERKLASKLKSCRKPLSNNSIKNGPAAESRDSGDDDDDEPESRTNAVAKRRALPLVSTPQSKKQK